MNALKTSLILAAAALCACAGAVTLKAAGGTAYYFGPVELLSPDGRLPYGKTEAALKREILDGGARIIETVTQPGAAPGVPARETVTELRRLKKKLAYSVSDAKGSFSGTVTFKDPELKSWTYNIKLAKGGDIKGSGSVSEAGIKTEKQLAGGRPMLVRENLKAVTEAEYLRRVEEFKPHKWAE